MIIVYNNTRSREGDKALNRNRGNPVAGNQRKEAHKMTITEKLAILKEIERRNDEHIREWKEKSEH